ncbi:MAG TPA: GxxExxY protein [Chloroflexi bacterium]|nr:GxxExxY protein [Chloroflexota bacterium]
MNGMEIDKLTERIIGCAYAVSNALGIGFVEKVYENAFAHELRKAGLDVRQQFPIKVNYDGIIVGEFFADLLVEENILIELKAVANLDSAHIAQALNYLRATGLETCLLINFGKPRIQVRNLKPSPQWKSSS